MSSGSCEPGVSPNAPIPFETLSAPALPQEPFTPWEIRALVHSGLPEGDACERVLALLARAEGALDLEIADGLAALSIGDRAASLGFSCIGNHARETLDIGAAPRRRR